MNALSIVANVTVCIVAPLCAWLEIRQARRAKKG